MSARWSLPIVNRSASEEYFAPVSGPAVTSIRIAGSSARAPGPSPITRKRTVLVRSSTTRKDTQGRPRYPGGTEIGEEIKGFEIVRRLGRGGMGEVFAAVRTGPGGFRRAVALKRLVDDAA